jgi:hypothetical protein
MHVHANQINPNAQLDAIYAAEKAAAAREAARTRRKLVEFASELAGESGTGDGCVVRVGARDEPQQQKKQQDQGSGKTQERASSEDPPNTISDWA